MYKIYADGVLIYDSTLEDYRIGKGQITLEVGKSGSFVFSVYPDHFYYDRFVQMKTVITVYKSGRIVFRGRVLDDVTDYWNNKTITCEGELGFLNDSIVRPYLFEGTAAELFARFIQSHNGQVDSFKQFKVGTVDITDQPIARDNTGYESTQSNLTSRLPDSGLGGYIYVTHGADGTEETPTVHYVKDFAKVATQGIEFGVNLKDFTKTTKGTEIATAIIPFGAQIDDGDASTENRRLTIESVNGGKDYVYDAEAVAYRGWIFQTVTWDDVVTAAELKTRAESWLATGVNLATTIELTAIDLHLLDRSIASYNVCEYVPVSSAPHGFAETMLCNRQTMDLLKPENDTVVLGYSYRSFTSNSTKLAFSVSNLSLMQSDVSNEVSKVAQHVNSITLSVENSETSSHLVLKAGETELASADIKLIGYVTFEGLSGGTTTIDGACIKTGTIAAERIDASDLKVDAANITGSLVIGQLPNGVATTDDIPANLSDLTNDVGFLTDADIPTKTSDLTNDSGFTNLSSVQSYIDNQGYQNASGVVSIINGTVDADFVNALGVTAAYLKGNVIDIGYGYNTFGYLYPGTNSADNTALTLVGVNGLRFHSGGNIFLQSSGGQQLLLGDGYVSLSGGPLLLPADSYGPLANRPSSGTYGQVYFALE